MIFSIQKIITIRVTRSTNLQIGRDPREITRGNVQTPFLNMQYRIIAKRLKLHRMERTFAVRVFHVPRAHLFRLCIAGRRKERSRVKENTVSRANKTWTG